MISPGQNPIPPVVPAAARDDDDDERVGPVLGIGDAEDDDTQRDVEDHEPVGRGDLAADIERTGGDGDTD
jgi:hypothetical protein